MCPWLTKYLSMILGARDAKQVTYDSHKFMSEKQSKWGWKGSKACAHVPSLISQKSSHSRMAESPTYKPHNLTLMLALPWAEAKHFDLSFWPKLFYHSMPCDYVDGSSLGYCLDLILVGPIQLRIFYDSVFLHAFCLSFFYIFFLFNILAFCSVQ